VSLVSILKHYRCGSMVGIEFTSYRCKAIGARVTNGLTSNNLLNIFMHLTRTLSVPVSVFFVLWCVSFQLSTYYPDLISDGQCVDVEDAIVKAQLHRITTVVNHDIVIIGDSSALMGYLPFEH